jgi:nucleotidyltransferase/DNA polymerase involved in DNA repair
MQGVFPVLKPIAVGGEKRDVIASASYEARRLGV